MKWMNRGEVIAACERVLGDAPDHPNRAEIELALRLMKKELDLKPLR
jgi:hypothetical protein